MLKINIDIQLWFFQHPTEFQIALEKINRPKWIFWALTVLMFTTYMVWIDIVYLSVWFHKNKGHAHTIPLHIFRHKNRTECNSTSSRIGIAVHVKQKHFALKNREQKRVEFNVEISRRSKQTYLDRKPLKPI